MNKFIFNRYRRGPHSHTFESIILRHAHDIEDMDISINDECIFFPSLGLIHILMISIEKNMLDLITASQDKRVGLLRIREPTFGPSSFASFR